MLLRNKHTGEIVEVNGGQGYLHTGDIAISFSSLDQLNSTWEDVPEEPKGYWYIRDGGNIDHNLYGKSIINRHKEIGNYFSSREEAKKAVEKLKAWKRLKDNGLVIKKWSHTPEMHLTTGSFLKIEGFIPAIMKNINDLDLLFGGEE